METLLDGIPLDRVTVSMTINAPAAILLALLLAVARRRGIPFDKLGGTVQNDVLKEYVARGTYIYPPAPVDASRDRRDGLLRARGSAVERDLDLRAITFARPARPRWKRSPSRSPTARRIFGRRATPASSVDAVAPRISFFWNAHNDFFEEVAKFRAARYLWAHITRDEFGCTRSALADAALSHADRRLDAHRAGAREQRRPRHAPGARRGAGRHAVAAYQRPRRGARAADRAEREGRAAHAADHRATSRASPTSSIRSRVRTTSRRSPTS